LHKYQDMCGRVCVCVCVLVSHIMIT